TQGSRLRNPSAVRGAWVAWSSIAIDLPVSPQRAIATTARVTRPPGVRPKTSSRVGEEPRARIVCWHMRPQCRGHPSWRGKRGRHDKAGALVGQRLRTPALYVLRTYQDCRAFAGRDTQVVRAQRSTLASDPRRRLG